MHYYRIVDSNTIKVLDQKAYDQEKNNTSAEQYIIDYNIMKFVFGNQFNSECFNVQKIFQLLEFNKLSENKYKLISMNDKEQTGIYKKHPIKEDEYIHLNCFNHYIIMSIIYDIQRICMQNKWEGVEVEIFNSRDDKYSFINYSIENNYKEKIIFNDNSNMEIYHSIFFDEMVINKINNAKYLEFDYKNKVFIGINNNEYNMLETLRIKINRI
jgi:hypothetical protein